MTDLPLSPAHLGTDELVAEIDGISAEFPEVATASSTCCLGCVEYHLAEDLGAHTTTVFRRLHALREELADRREAGR